MTVKRKIRRTTKQYIMVAIICVLVMGSAAAITAIMITDQIKSRYQMLLSELEKELEDNQRTVYIASADIMAGDFVTMDNVTAVTAFAGQPAGSYMTSEDVGKVVLIDIAVGTQLIKGMLSENVIAAELREMEYNVISISSNITDSDTVDVRIVFPNGENYIVLSKKILKGYVPGTTSCCLWLSEDELLHMSAAIVDASLYAGSSIYVTKYIEPSIQEASVANYTPSLSVLALLESDPNVLRNAEQKLSMEVRKALENRLADSMSTDVSQINWAVSQSSVKQAAEKDQASTTKGDVTAESQVPNQDATMQNTEEVQHDLADQQGRNQYEGVAQEGEEQEATTQEGTVQEDMMEEEIQEQQAGSELGSIPVTEDYFYYAEQDTSYEADLQNKR